MCTPRSQRLISMSKDPDLMTDAEWAKVPKQKPICTPTHTDEIDMDVELIFQAESQRGAGVIKIHGGYRQTHVLDVIK